MGQSETRPYIVLKNKIYYVRSIAACNKFDHHHHHQHAVHHHCDCWHSTSSLVLNTAYIWYVNSDVYTCWRRNRRGQSFVRIEIQIFRAARTHSRAHGLTCHAALPRPASSWRRRSMCAQLNSSRQPSTTVYMAVFVTCESTARGP